MAAAISLPLRYCFASPTVAISAVAVNGRWVERVELDKRRAALAARYQVLTGINDEVDQTLERADAITAIEQILASHGDDGEMRSAIERRVNSAGYAAASAGRLDRAHAILEIGAETTVQVGDVATLLGPDDPAILTETVSERTGMSRLAIMQSMGARLPRRLV